jgi:hypothetical protein
MKNDNRFTLSKEILKHLGYYVYRLIDPRTGNTFYVGKGKGNRIFDHINGVDNSNIKNDKQRVISEITNAGLEIIYIIHRHGIKDENTAYEVEAALLDAYPEVTNENAGNGSSDYGQISLNELIKKYSAVELKEIKHHVVMITINHAIKERSIYEATRYARVIDKKRAEQAEYVFAVEHGVIVGVFKANEWKTVSIKNGFPIEYEKRYGFDGVDAPLEIKKIYLNKRVPKKYRIKGASNPIKYSF